MQSWCIQQLQAKELSNRHGSKGGPLGKLSELAGYWDQAKKWKPEEEEAALLGANWLLYSYRYLVQIYAHKFKGGTVARCTYVSTCASL